MQVVVFAFLSSAYPSRSSLQIYDGDSKLESFVLGVLLLYFSTEFILFSEINVEVVNLGLVIVNEKIRPCNYVKVKFYKSVAC